MKQKEENFQKLNEAKRDKNIIGFFLGVSRGKGKATTHSDCDIFIMVKDGFFARALRLLTSI